MTRIADQDFVRSCHDVSQGGLAVAIAEMCFAKGFGADVLLPNLDVAREPKSKAAEFLFSESNSRFLMEVEGGEEEKLEKVMKGMPLLKIGSVSNDTIKIMDRNNQDIIKLPTAECYNAWTSAFSS